MQYLAEAVNDTIEVHCVSDFAEEWNVEGLHGELKSYWPTTLTVEDLAACQKTDDLYNVAMKEAKAYYDQREETLTPEVMRHVERQVMLRIIDQRWREHLQEMDYLHEGINLRAMGQKDPLVEWQREGYEMFGQLMTGVAQDFVRYVMHVQVVTQPTQQAAPAVQDVVAEKDEAPEPSALATPTEDELLDAEEREEEPARVEQVGERVFDEDGKPLSRAERRRLEREAAKKKS
jgi:preprotein translocase subunit SecA